MIKMLNRTRLLPLLFAALMISAVITGCKSEGKASALPEKQFIDKVFEYEYIDLPEGIGAVSQLIYTDDRLYITGWKDWKKSISDRMLMFSMNHNGTDVREEYLPVPDENYLTVSVSAAGNGVMCFLTLGSPLPEASGLFRTTALLEIYRNREKIGTTDIAALLDIAEQNTSENTVSINSVFAENDGSITVFTSEYVAFISPEGELLKTVAYGLGDSASVGNAISTGDGIYTVFTAYYDIVAQDNAYALMTVNVKTLTVSSPIPASEAVTSGYTRFMSDENGDENGGCEFYRCIDKDGIYGYTDGGNTETKLLDWVNSALDTNMQFSLLKIIDGKTIYAVFTAHESRTDRLLKLTKVPQEKLLRKYIITFAGDSITNTGGQSLINGFNRQSDEYHIVLKQYEDTVSGYVVRAGGITEKNIIKGTGGSLEEDLRAGKAPDLMMLSDKINTDIYASKGLFGNIYDILDESGLDRTDYIAEVMTACAIGDRLYEIIPSFGIVTLAGKTGKLGGTEGWSIEEYNSYTANLPAGVLTYIGLSREDFLKYSLMASYGTFVNEESGECTFENEAFISLLTAAKDLKSTSVITEVNSPAEFDEDFWAKPEYAYFSDRAMLYSARITNFRMLAYLRASVFGDSVGIAGFPSEDRAGSIAYGNFRIAVSASTPYKEAVREFIAYLLSDSYQDTIAETGSYFPIKKSSLEKMAATQLESEPYTALNGKKTEIPVTKEDINVILTALRQIKHSTRINGDVLNIIYEEAEPFYDGRKTAEETAGIIQNRAQIIVNEGR